MAARKKKAAKNLTPPGRATSPTAHGGEVMRRSCRCEQIRGRIDSVDAQLHALINERAHLAQQVGVSKHASGHTVDFYRPEREAQVAAACAPTGSATVTRTARWRDERDPCACSARNQSACPGTAERAEDRYWGPEGTFTQQAVLKFFGHSVASVAVDVVQEVFHEVESGAADFGVVPIENSTEARVKTTRSHVPTTPLKIIARWTAHPART